MSALIDEEDLSLFSEIYLSKEKIREIVKFYDGLPKRMIARLLNDKFVNEKSLIDRIENYSLDNMSMFLFPGEYVEYYPQIMNRIAKSQITCNISGTKILIGEEYITYHGFMERLKTGECYVTSNIVSTYDYYSIYPKTFKEYENWYYKIKNSYFVEDNEIDFYQLSCECGETCLEPRKLAKKRRP